MGEIKRLGETPRFEAGAGVARALRGVGRLHTGSHLRIDRRLRVVRRCVPEDALEAFCDMSCVRNFSKSFFVPSASSVLVSVPSPSMSWTWESPALLVTELTMRTPSD